MCGMVLAFPILPTPASGSLLGLQNKTFCHQASWKVSKRTAMRFGIWTKRWADVTRARCKSPKFGSHWPAPKGVGTNRLPCQLIDQTKGSDG